MISVEYLKDLGIDITNIVHNPIENKDELIKEIHKFKKKYCYLKLNLTI